MPMKKLVNFSVALMTTTLLCLSCQKEDVVAQMDVTTTKSENVQNENRISASSALMPCGEGEEAKLLRMMI